MRAKTFFAALITLLATSLVWTYLTYDLLASRSLLLFSLANAPWTEEYQPGLFRQLYFWLFLIVGLISTFGITGFIAARLSPGSYARELATVTVLGTAPIIVRGILASVAQFGQGILVSFLYLTLAWLIGFGLARVASKTAP